MKTLVSTLLVSISLTALVAGNAAAQINYDPANHAYFVVGDGVSLNSNISGNEVFVGKNNAASFATLPGSFNFTVGLGGNITSFGSNLPGGPYNGLNVFGAHNANILAGNVSTVTAFDTSTVTVGGGVVSSLTARGNSTVNINGGTVTNPSANGASKLNINGGTVSSFFADGTSTVNLKAGTLDGFTSVGSNTVNMTGGKVTYTGQIYGSTVNVTGGTLSNTYLSGGTLNIGTGGRVNSTQALGGTINVTGGNASGINGEWGTEINVSGGTVGGIFGYRENTVNISGGTVNSAEGRSASVVNISGGEVNDATATNFSHIHISGGNVQKATARGGSSLYVDGGFVYEYFGDSITVAGGSVNFPKLDSSGIMNVTGGDGGWISGGANSTVNVTGGMVWGTGTDLLNISGGNVWSTYSKRVNITGGLVMQASHSYQGSVNISGGTVSRPETTYMNISGGTVGGFGEEAGVFGFGVERGIYQIGGTLNLYGSGFERTNIVPGETMAGPGTFSTLTGTLLDGTPLNTLFFLGDGATYEFRGGGTQGNAVMPNSIGNGVFTFTDVPSGAWFDPPTVDSFLFTMTDGNLFTGILDFPTGFASAFEVRVGNLLLGAFGAGQAVNFADFGFANGVGSFSIESIMPGVDSENPEGFPIRLGFSAPFASFTMQGFGVGSSAAPEPGTVGLVLLGGICTGIAWRKTAGHRA